MTADDLIGAARVCLGTPFVHQGRRPGQALDCAGLLVHVASTVGCPVIDRAGYGRDPSGNALWQAIEAQPFLVRVTPPDLATAGDLLLLRFSGAPQHLALHCGATIVHAWEAVGAVCEHAFSAVWQRRVAAVWRFLAVEA